MRNNTLKTAIILAVIGATTTSHVVAQHSCLTGNCYDGYGVYQDERFYYTGFFKDGLPNGYGIMNSTDGNCYVGQFKDGKYDMKGTFYWNDGTRLIGYWKNGKPHGQCAEIQPNGKTSFDIYENGAIMEGKTPKDCVYGNKNDGFCIYFYEDNSVYEGYNKKGKHHGHGKLTRFDGSVYEGEFKNDKFNGYGELSNPDGTIEAGMWVNDKFDGVLKNQKGCVSGDCENSYSVYVENGDKYFGDFKDGKPNGQGKYIFKNGDTYQGSVAMGKVEGSGTMNFADSSSRELPLKYVGDFKNGKPHGYGAMIFRNSDIYYGKFAYGKYDGEGVFLGHESVDPQAGIYSLGNLVTPMNVADIALVFGNKNGFGIKMTEYGKFFGNLMDGEPSGHGMLEFYSGQLIIGDFDEGKANGQCISEDPSRGVKYVGQISNNKITGRGVMYYADGTKEKGYFKNGKLTQETYNAAIAPPSISWTKPVIFNTQVLEGTTTIQLCVSSNDPIDEISVWDNGVSKVKKATRGYQRKNAVCDYSFEFVIDLVPGRNELVAMVKNEGGTTKTEPRYVTWESSDLVSNQKKVALVIGNSDYEYVAKLRNPANDAELMTTTLESIGFEVISLTNVGRKEMKQAVYDFGERLSQEKAVGLFYYAGHGIQVDGVNYMVPTTAALEDKDDVEDICFSINKVLGQMAYANNDLNIVILDACRDNPFRNSMPKPSPLKFLRKPLIINDGDDGGGLAQLNAPKGTFIAFSTSPGKTAFDGTGQNGLYTEQLAKAIKTPGFKLEDVFKQVRNEVFRISRENFGEGKEQIPWENSSIFGDFYFIK